MIHVYQGFRPGESIAIFGAGPVGLMSAYSAALRGASDVYVVDRVAERLNKVQEIGCIPIDFSNADAVDQILELRGGSVKHHPSKPYSSIHNDVLTMNQEGS